jgi:hypothetical protein
MESPWERPEKRRSLMEGGGRREKSSGTWIANFEKGEPEV